MRTLSQHLIHYAHYHRDPRNIHTHFVGIPLIVLAVASLLAPAATAGWGERGAPGYADRGGVLFLA